MFLKNIYHSQTVLLRKLVGAGLVPVNEAHGTQGPWLQEHCSLTCYGEPFRGADSQGGRPAAASKRFTDVIQQ